MLGLALGLLVIAGALGPGRVAKVGANAGVNQGAGDLRDISAHNSPNIARNPADPLNLVIANRIDLPRFSCAAHFSVDGGATWRETAVPFPEGEELPERCYAPDAVFGPGGTLYLSFTTLIGLGNTPNAVWTTSSSDGGRSFSVPTRALGPLAFQTALVADQRVEGRLYLSWLQAEVVANLGFATPGSPIKMARSDDAGKTWRTPVTVSPSSRPRVVAPSVAIGADGEVFILYLDLGDDRLDYSGAHGGRGGDPYPGSWSLLLARSGDRGLTWSETVVDAGIQPATRMVVFLPPTPALAVDPDGERVHVAFSDARLGDADVWIWSSQDRGSSFGERQRVNDTPRRDGTAQYLPAMAVAPDGRVDVLYYDRRADEDDVMNEVSLQSSFDHGASFESRLRLSRTAFDSRIGFGSERGLADLGSRLALISAESRALAVWTDTRAGTEASGKQDLARVIAVVAEPEHPARGPLRLLSVTLVILGLLCLLSCAVWRRGKRGKTVP